MAAPKKSTTTKKTVTKKAVKAAVSSGVAAAKSAVKKIVSRTTASKSTQSTKVIAQIDVGFGNSLYIRGNGAGLSWDQGKLMSWSDGAWSWSSSAKGDVEFKVLINDQTWACGENLTVKSGKQISFVPQF